MNEYLHNAHKQNLKSLYHYNKKSCDTVHNSRLTEVFVYCIKRISLCNFFREILNFFWLPAASLISKGKLLILLISGCLCDILHHM